MTQMTFCSSASGVFLIIRNKSNVNYNYLIYILTIAENYMHISNKELFFEYYDDYG